jgi:hypothetical protein
MVVWIFERDEIVAKKVQTMKPEIFATVEPDELI